jgi:hypothetical protein
LREVTRYRDETYGIKTRLSKINSANTHFTKVQA